MRGMVLEPASLAVGVKMQGPSGNLTLDVSNLRLNLSPDILELAISLQASVLEPLIQPPAEQPVSKCTSFVQVQACAAWHARTPNHNAAIALTATCSIRAHFAI